MSKRRVNWKKSGGDDIINYYTILGVDPTITPKDLTKAYRALSKKVHPDKGGNTDTSAEVNAAYTVLKDPASRQMHDAQLAAAADKDIKMNILDYILKYKSDLSSLSLPDLKKHATTFLKPYNLSPNMLGMFVVFFISTVTAVTYTYKKRQRRQRERKKQEQEQEQEREQERERQREKHRTKRRHRQRANYKKK